MVIRRIREHVAAHNWFAVSVDVAIVVVGVFLGTQVSNWNEQRLEKAETQRMLSQLHPELDRLLDFFAGARDYYATTRTFADTAFAGWEQSKKVTDKEFVIAAYQASQIMGIGADAENWTLVLGGDRLRTVEDPKLRRMLSIMMANNFDTVSLPAVATKYREDVRRVIPDPVQVAIRERCGDRADPNRPLVTILPKVCDLKIPDDLAAQTAAALRANPHLIGELRWHQAAVASFLANGLTLEAQTRALADTIHTS